MTRRGTAGSAPVSTYEEEEEGYVTGSGEWDEVFELVKIRVKVNSDQFNFVLRSDNDPLLVLDPLRGRCARDGTRPPDAL